ncbi:MAG: phosphodiester glycosidase family protein [Sporichthyaceae bacterium]
MSALLPSVVTPAVLATGLALVAASVTLAAPANAGAPERPGLAAPITLGTTADSADGSTVASATKRKTAPVPQSIPATLSLGPAGLEETRTDKTLAPGVVLTTIARGSSGSAQERWVVRTITIDPKIAKGNLGVTYGPTLAGNDRTSDMLREVNALAGVNGSFFTPKSSTRPGDPMGLTMSGGKVLSEPSPYGAEVTLLVDSAANTMKVTRLRWTGTVRNETGAGIAVSKVNGAPGRNQVALITSEYGRKTPSGSGIEVVLDGKGCVAKVATTRGTKLRRGQSTLQATGTAAKKLAGLAGKGCLAVEHTLTDKGRPVEVTESLSAMTGRVWLLNDGAITASDRDRYLWRRHPRTVAGFTWDGKLVFMTVDGRSKKSVGASMIETATIARELGLRDAVNLDGGGSTTMAVEGKVVNGVRTERAVSDALVWLVSKG